MNFRKCTRWAQACFASLLVTGLVACGGGGGGSGTPAGTAPGTGTTTTIPAASIDLSASASLLATAGGTLTITAVVKSAANSAIAGQAIAFSATSGALQGAVVLTDANGSATVTLSPGTDRSDRVITVTAASSGATGVINIPVTGSTLTLAGNSSLLVSSGVNSYTLRALDSAGAGISGATLAVRSALGNAVTPATVVTDATGSATVSYTPTIAGSDSLLAAGLGMTATLAVSVSSQDFVFVAPGSNASLPTNAGQTVTVRLRSAGVGVAGRTVNFNSTRGTVSPVSAVTDANGQASTTVTSTSSGPGTLTATIANTATATQSVQFVATTVASVVLQANPNAIPPNTAGSTTNRIALVATVRDSSGNAVANASVGFSAVDPSGGSISPGTKVTDANGQASVTFFPGSLSTPTNGVLATATEVSSGISGTTTLTVSGRSVFITINVGNTITNLDPNTYAKPFSVFVTDANGAALVSQPIVLSVIATQYRKGRLAYDGTNWSYQPAAAATSTTAAVTASPTATCLNEDSNANGILDANEDTNGNGRLTPGGVVAVSAGTVTTDATGVATFNLLYGEQYVPWINSLITARATVAGTESSSTFAFASSGSADDFTSASVPPAGTTSPFGVATTCTNPN
jgi:hypothetical protein